MTKVIGTNPEGLHNSPLNALSKTLGNNADNSSPVADCNSRSDASRPYIIIRDPKGFLG